MSNRYTFLLILLASLLIVPAAASAQTSPVKMGFVDIERINTEYSKIKLSVELLNDSFQQLQKDLDLYYDRVQEASAVKTKLQKQFDSEAQSGGPKTVTEDKVLEALRDWSQKRDEYFSEYRKLSDKFDTAKEVLLYPRLVEVSEAVREVGETGGYSVIMKKELAKYGAARNDVTDKVLKLLHERAARKKASAGEGSN